MKDNTEAMKQLNEAADEYCIRLYEYDVADGYLPDKKSYISSFKAGALSIQAANGCNKHVEKAKIDFAIEVLVVLEKSQREKGYSAPELVNKISELTKQRKQYE